MIKDIKLPNKTIKTVDVLVKTKSLKRKINFHSITRKSTDFDICLILQYKYVVNNFAVCMLQGTAVF